jgi:hypothetical protein
VPRFVRKHDNGNIEIFTFNGTALVGRSSKAQVRIEDGSVSAKHAEVNLTPEGYEVTDLESRNGTRINDKDVTKGKLANGDQVTFGKIVCVFEMDDAAAPAAAPAQKPPEFFGTGMAFPKIELPPDKPADRPSRAPRPAEKPAEKPAPAPAAKPAAPPAPAPAPAPQPHAAIHDARRGGEQADIKIRILKEQVRGLQKQRVILSALCCGLALATVVFLIAFLIYRTKTLELQHGIGRPEVEEGK